MSCEIRKEHQRFKKPSDDPGEIWAYRQPPDAHYIWSMLPVVMAALKKYEAGTQIKNAPIGIQKTLLQKFERLISEYCCDLMDQNKEERILYKVSTALEEIYRQVPDVDVSDDPSKEMEQLNKTKVLIEEKIGPVLRKILGTSEEAEDEIDVELTDITLSRQEIKKYTGAAEAGKEMTAELFNRSKRFIHNIQRRKHPVDKPTQDQDWTLLRDFLQRSLSFSPDIIEKIMMIQPPPHFSEPLKNIWMEMEDGI